MYMYKVWLGRIDKVEINGQTKQFVILPNGRREAKDSGWRSWHPYFQTAKNRLLADTVKELNELIWKSMATRRAMSDHDRHAFEHHSAPIFIAGIMAAFIIIIILGVLGV